MYKPIKDIMKEISTSINSAFKYPPSDFTNFLKCIANVFTHC